MDKLKGYRTIVFNVIMAISMLMTIFFGVDVSGDATKLKEGIDMALQGLTTIWGIGSIWLRIITDSPIFKGKSNDGSNT